MSIPDFQSLMLPFLEAISDGKTYENREVDRKLAARFNLTDGELAEKLQGGTPVFTNRVAWVKSYLKRAGLTESPKRGQVRITPQGEQVLRDPPDKIDIRFLKKFDAFDWHRKGDSAAGDDQADLEEESGSQTPEELLISSYQALREALAEELLEQVRRYSPPFFERLVVDLLVAMGYGGSVADAAQVIGKSGDGGIDGLIKEDKLGLDVICVQAKRWEGTVGRPVVQAFAGSMEGVRARKGVLITTSAFSSDAKEYVKQIERKIILIDGVRLAELMIDHNIGVSISRSYEVKKIDSDYFIEDEL
jgi:restriction system protein